MKTEEYERYDAVGLADLVRRREVTPTELLNCAVEQVTRLNPKLNAVVDLYFDRATRQIEAGLPMGPFTGVPLLLKDDLELAGTRMTLGSVFMKGRLCEHTHPVAARLQAAGFVFIGRTNMSELGLLPITEPTLYGATLNPWAPHYSPGGSSGGSAAAVASRMVPIAQSSDGGGSTRVPASACGLVGLKPSRGRNPTSLRDDPHGFVVRSCVTRTARDSAAFLDVTASASTSNRWRLPPVERPFSSCLETEPQSLRVGFLLDDGAGNSAQPDCRAAVEHTALLCERLGHRVEQARLAIDVRAYNEAFLVLWAMCAGYYWRQIRAAIRERAPRWLHRGIRNPMLFETITRLAQEAGPLKSPFEPFTRRLAAIDANHSPSDLWSAWSTMAEADMAFARFFEKYDLLLCPVLGRPPWKIGHFRHGWSDHELRTQLFPYLGQTHMANTTGLPAISLPLYWTQEGLPIGSQLFASWGREDLLIGLAAALERAAPFRECQME